MSQKVYLQNRVASSYLGSPTNTFGISWLVSLLSRCLLEKRNVKINFTLILKKSFINLYICIFIWEEEIERERERWVCVCVWFFLYSWFVLSFIISILFILSMPDSYDLLDSQPFSIFRSQKKGTDVCATPDFRWLSFNIITCLNLVIKISSSYFEQCSFRYFVLFYCYWFCSLIAFHLVNI